MSVRETILEAARELKLVRLVEAGDRERVGEPHIVYRDKHGRPMLHLYQVGGYSSHEPEGHGWRNLPLERFGSAHVVDQAFHARLDYNPDNRELFPYVVYAIPTRDGRQREPDGD